MSPVITSGGYRTTAIILDSEDWDRVEAIRKEKRHRHRSVTLRELIDLGIKEYRREQKLMRAIDLAHRGTEPEAVAG
jgi:hypothetical protein